VKAHAAVSSNSLPLVIIVGAGNEHDSRRFEQVVSNVRINIGRGRPRTKPGEVLADAAYDTESIRCYLRKRGIKSSIPPNKRNRKKPQEGDQLDLTMGHTRKEELLSDSLDGSNSDSGEFP
jgi:Transposase DDE domain